MKLESAKQLASSKNEYTVQEQIEMFEVFIGAVRPAFKGITETLAYRIAREANLSSAVKFLYIFVD